nr:hypothetical protein [uncultured Brevundimonas sp.]
MTRKNRRLQLDEALSAAIPGMIRGCRSAWGALGLSAVVWGARPFIEGGVVWAWMLAAIVATVVATGALTRVSISDDLAGARRLGLGPVGLQFRMPELRLAGAAALCAVFMAMIVSVVALVLLAVFGMAGLDSSAIQARDWAAVGPAWKLALLAVLTVGVLFAVAALIVRLSLFAAATVGRGHMVSLNSMALTRKVFWPLFAGLIGVAAPKFVLIGLWASGLLAGAAGWVAWAVVLNVVQGPLAIAYLGAVYRQVEFQTPQGGARD